MKKIILGLLLIGFTTVLSASYFPRVPVGHVTKQNRTEYAEKFKLQLENILSSIPNLTPSEKKYLDNEYKQADETNNIDRLDRLFDKEIYVIRSTKIFLIDLISILNEYILSAKSNRMELKGWVKFSDKLMMSEQNWKWIVKLSKLGYINPKSFTYKNKLNVNILYSANGMQLSHSINTRIIMRLIDNT